MKLDKIDSRILSELSLNCRQELATLAQTLKLGRDRIKYRIKKLEKAGVIASYRIKVNPNKFGFFLYKRYIHLKNNHENKQELINYLANHPRTFWLAECYGQWDLVHVTCAENSYIFQTFQDDLLSKYNKLIDSVDMYVLTGVWYFSRGYLSGATMDLLSDGGAPANIELSALDFKILKLLAEDSRQAYSSLGKKLHCAPATVRYRIERLEKLGVITLYYAELDIKKLGMLLVKAQVYLDNFDIHKEEELRLYCRHNPYITFFLKQIGNCKIEIEFEVASMDQYSEELQVLLEKFRGFIKNVVTVMTKNQSYKNIPRGIHSMVK